MFPMDFNRIEKRECALRDASAPHYEEWVFRTKGELWDKMEKETVLRAVCPKSENVILDAGCGVGRHSLLLSKKTKEVISIDFSEKSLKILKDKMQGKGITNIKILSCDIAQPLPLTDCFIDKILSSQVLQHIPDANKRQDVLRGFHQMLKVGGLLILVLYRWGGAIKSSKEGFFDNGLYRYAFTRKECIKLLRETGFSNVRVQGMINIPKLRHIPKVLWRFCIYSEFLLQRLPLSPFIGKFLLVSGRKGSV